MIRNSFICLFFLNFSIRDASPLLSIKPDLLSTSKKVLYDVLQLEVSDSVCVQRISLIILADVYQVEKFFKYSTVVDILALKDLRLNEDI